MRGRGLGGRESPRGAEAGSGRKGQGGDRWTGVGKAGAGGQGWVGRCRTRWMSSDETVGGGSPPSPPHSFLSSHRSPAPCRFWFRLYWFPLKVLYATCHCSLRSVPDIPFYFFFNALLLLLTLMNLYWFLVSRQPTAPRRPPSSAGSPVLVPVLSSGPGAGPPSQAGPERSMFTPGTACAKGWWQERTAIWRAAGSGKWHLLTCASPPPTVHRGFCRQGADRPGARAEGRAGIRRSRGPEPQAQQS